MRRFVCFCLSLVAASASFSASAQLPTYTLFESDPVQPIALSPDGTKLFAVNTQEGRLEVRGPSDLGSSSKVASVPVGMEPVSVAVRSNDEVWVVNHLSDSVSIVDVSADPPVVTRTLLVGDEPRGIVFAGPGGNLAFIATAHRGQNTPWPDGDFDTPGTGRADVWVFDANNLDSGSPGSSLGGDPVTVINLFGDRPRALAASPDGSTVYAAVYRSGNKTVPVSEGNVCDNPGACVVQGTVYPGGRPDPVIGYCSNDLNEACDSNSDCATNNCIQRETGLIVGYNEASGNYEDELGRNWDPAIRFSLPDYDVFEINANASPVPVEVASGRVAGVGTILFNMIVNPANQKLYVTNTEANNRVRFEGACDYESEFGPKSSGDPCSVRGNLHRARVTVVDAVGAVTPRHLNKHLNYDVATPPSEKAKSVGQPLDMAISSDGATLYVAGFGSNGIAIYDTGQLENDTFVPDAANIISGSGIEGPIGLALDEARGLLWILASRSAANIYSYNLSTGAIRTAGSWNNPEPDAVVDGRKFLYDTQLTSSNGEAACGACHLFGDMDDESWDLGDPDVTPFVNSNPRPSSFEFPLLGLLPPNQPFDALKGPMTTQSLRGMDNHGPMHWRGDRTGAPVDGLDENAAFLAFNPAFPGLIGRDEGEIDPADMQAFADFSLALTYPPNPIRNLDNSLSASAAAGESLYNGEITDRVANCNGCHVLDRAAGFFGSAGATTFENETMEFKVPHLRNAYQKVGMFGIAPTDFFPDAPGIDQGPQVRGTGFLHDGSVATVFDFLRADVFSTSVGGNNSVSDTEARNLERFIMEFDTNLAPAVGQQTTVTANTGASMIARADFLIQRAESTYFTNGALGAVPECDLIAKGVVDGTQRGWVYDPSGNTFDSDDDSDPDAPWTRNSLISAAQQAGNAVTFTCVPPGSGERMGIDRDLDGNLDQQDMNDCSVGRITPERRSSLTVTLAIMGLGLGLMRRRRRA
ncbi:MAG: hypothetical protein AAGF92_15240 [Myxococcota bacterium]